MVLKCIVVFVTFGVICTNSYTFDGIGKTQENESVSNGLLATTEDTMAEIKIGNNSSQLSLKSKRRSKRSVFNLISMIHCATDCSVWELMDYGNYCGWGGSGRALNSIDRCCMYHDNCYGDAIIRYGFWSSYSTYIRSYKWYCNGGDPFCGHYQPNWRRALCDCDLELIKCFQYYGCP